MTMTEAQKAVVGLVLCTLSAFAGGIWLGAAAGADAQRRYGWSTGHGRQTEGVCVPVVIREQEFTQGGMTRISAWDDGPGPRNAGALSVRPGMARGMSAGTGASLCLEVER